MSLTTSTFVHPTSNNSSRDQFTYMNDDFSPDSSSNESQNIDSRIKNIKLKVPLGGTFDEPVKSASEGVEFEYGSFSDIKFQRGFNMDSARYVNLIACINCLQTCCTIF
jgi:hypothetical protein